MACLNAREIITSFSCPPSNGRYFEGPMNTIPIAPETIMEVLSPKKFPIIKIAAITISAKPIQNIVVVLLRYVS